MNQVVINSQKQVVNMFHLQLHRLLQFFLSVCYHMTFLCCSTMLNMLHLSVLTMKLHGLLLPKSYDS